VKCVWFPSLRYTAELITSGMHIYDPFMWISNSSFRFLGRNIGYQTLVKSVLHQCVTCARARAIVPGQLMGQLPRTRVPAPARTFLHCSVDFVGRDTSLLWQKNYIAQDIAVFICLATRAVHLELVGGYSNFCVSRCIYSILYAPRIVYRYVFRQRNKFYRCGQELTRSYQDDLQDPDFQNRTASDKVS